MALPHVHVITPGDHFSPRTGSAIPTVVHGLATAGAARGQITRVAVARGTYPDRYGSAEVLEYTERPAGRYDRRVDAVTGRVGLGRPRTRRRYAASVADQADWPPSVILAHNAPQLIGAIDASRHTPVLYAHNELLRTYSQREAGRVLGNAARIICVSEYLADRTRDRLPTALRDRVVVVRNGVDTQFFHPSSDAGPAGGLNVTFVGRMIPDKGADVLVEAIRLLGRSDVTLTLVGSAGFDPDASLSSFETAVRTAAASLPGPVDVHAFRPRDRVAADLRCAHVLVVPSRWPEPCGLTVLEGMASGLPTIASQVGGIPEIASDGCLLIPPDDPAALATELGRLADDPERRSELGRRARASVRSWSAASDDLRTHLGDTSEISTGG